MPDISVIVPVYKVEAYLARCVDSILAQTFTDFELILVDDGSPDTCPAICDNYKEKDSRVIVLHKENGGLSSARNAGLDYLKAGGTSEWVTFIDSDDWVEKDYLKILYTLAMDNHVLCAACGFSLVYENKPVLHRQNDTTVISAPDDFYGKYRFDGTVSNVCAHMKLYKRELFTGIRYPFGRINEDRFTTHKLLFQCDKIAVTDKALYNYYQSPNSIMRSAWSPKRLDDFDAFEEQLAFFRSGNHTQAYDRTIHEFFSAFCEQLNNAEKTGRYEKEIKALKKRQKKALALYARDCNITIINHPEYYMNQRPVAAAISVFFHKINNKICHIFHIEAVR